MDRDEIRSWFDKAVTLMFQGDFAGAAICFQTVIDRSDDLYAIRIAKRDLGWCYPLQSVVEYLHSTAHPLLLDELIKQFTQITDPAKLDVAAYVDELSIKLGQVQSVCQLNENLWVSQPCLHDEIRRVLGDESGNCLPATLPELARCLFVGYTSGQVVYTPQLSNQMRSALKRLDRIAIVESDCVFHVDKLKDFAIRFADIIRTNRKPQTLATAIDMAQWPQSVGQSVQIEALGQWLSMYAQVELLEIAFDRWFPNELIDLTPARITDAFQDPFGTLSAEDIMCHCFFPTEQNIRLLPGFVRRQVVSLECSPSVVRVGQDLWTLKQSLEALLAEVDSILSLSDLPITIDELLDAQVEKHPSVNVYRKELGSAILNSLNQNPSAVRVSQTTWMHQQGIPRLLDRVYYELTVKPYKIKELSEFIGSLSKDGELSSEFARAFHNALSADDRFMLNADEYWRSIPTGNRLNNLAYMLLYNEHCSLTLQDIAERAAKYRGRVVRFQLGGDPRFRQSPGGRWMLSNWILINDLAAQYLANIKTPQTKQIIIGQVCAQFNIAVALAVFEPELDSRFIGDRFGRWICQSAGSILTDDMIDNLVQAAKDSTWGIPLEQLVRNAFHRSLSDFFDVANTLLRDGRLIVADGLWYPRECLYSVTPGDLEKIKAYLAPKLYPVSAIEIAQVCLDRPLGLTNLSDELDACSDFINIGGTGWLLRTNQTAAVGRQRQINYPIHSGKFVPAINPELLVEVEHSAEPSITESHPGTLSLPSTRPKQLRITLTFEDIRDGSLVATSNLQSFLGAAIELPGFAFVDESFETILCWYDSEHNLVHGLRPWFEQKRLSFGDVIRLKHTRKDNEFLIQKTGECNEQVRHEGLRRSQVEDLRQEAIRVNRSYHDLTIEILEHFKAPLNIDDLWALVDYRRTARKSTISSILSSYPYFVSVGKGYWRFDEKEYAKMIQELQHQIKQLTADNLQLRSQLDSNSQHAEEYAKLTGENESLRRELDLSQQTLRQTMGAKEQLLSQVRAGTHEVAKLRTDLEDQSLQMEHLRNELSAQIEDNKHLRERMHSYDDKLDQLSGNMAKLTNENQLLHANVDAYKAQAQHLQQELTERLEETGSLKSVLKSTVDESRALKSTGVEQQEQIALLTANIERQRADWLAAVQKAGEVEMARQQLEEENQRTRTELHGVTTSLLETRERVIQLENSLAEVNHQLLAKESQDSQAPVQISELQEALKQRDLLIQDIRDKEKSIATKLEDVSREKDLLNEALERTESEHQQVLKEYSRNERILSSVLGRIARWWTGLRQ